ncbi:MAG: hypothetical protein JJU06_16770 [Ectothiorhodospiraceae bacterium]|nr:hypothetical protein [Ectothiorhodospiraceae bacterium]
MEFGTVTLFQIALVILGGALVLYLFGMVRAVNAMEHEIVETRRKVEWLEFTPQESQAL